MLEHVNKTLHQHNPIQTVFCILSENQLFLALAKGCSGGGFHLTFCKDSALNQLPTNKKPMQDSLNLGTRQLNQHNSIISAPKVTATTTTQHILSNDYNSQHFSTLRPVSHALNLRDYIETVQTIAQREALLFLFTACQAVILCIDFLILVFCFCNFVCPVISCLF